MDATLLDVAGGVATITLNQPDNRNALSRALVHGLWDHLHAALGDDAVRVIVVTNAGSVFCAGADLADRPDQMAAGAGSGPGLADLLALLTTAPKPTVGRIAGHCSGGGVGLAAAFDIAVADESVKFGFTEVRLGVAPAVISVVCLPKLSRRDAMELFLRGTRWPAAKAAEVGLITSAVPASALDADVDVIVADLLLGGPLALAASKDIVNRVPAMAPADAFAEMARLSGELFRSVEAAEGIAAYRDKRPPAWVPGE